MSDQDQAQLALRGDPDHTEPLTGGQGSQKISREAAGDQLDVGPHFPSGMNSVEAAMSGATANLSDEQLEKIDSYREVLGDAAPGGASARLSSGSSRTRSVTAGTRDDDEDDTQEYDEYDPSQDTIDDVLAYVDENPDERDEVLRAERAGKNRSTLVSQLEAR